MRRVNKTWVPCPECKRLVFVKRECHPRDVEIIHKTGDVNGITLSNKSYSETERDKFVCECGFQVEVVNFKIVMATGVIMHKQEDV